MPNIFTPLNILKTLKSTSGLSIEQEYFITKLLDKKVLPHAIKSGSPEEIKIVINLLTNEINHSSYLNLTAPYVNYNYIKGLKKALTILSQTVKKMETPPSHTQKFTNHAKKIDLIYEETVKTYHGQIMLPIIQGVDFRLAFSNGECFGYMSKWALDLLNNQRAFGVHVNDMPVFKPIKLNSVIGQKYPDLNHLAKLTETISDYQAHQLRLKQFFEKSNNEKEKNIYIYKEKIPYFFKSVTQIANDLITTATNNEVDNVLGLNMYGYRIGHALGFYQKNNKYHFFDCNSGWYAFNNAQDFIEWLPFYFETMGYDKLFLERTITSFAKTPIPNSSITPEVVNKDVFAKAMIKIICSPLLAPVLLAAYGYVYVIRGCVYGIYNIGNMFANLRQAKVLNPSDQSNPSGLNETSLSRFSTYQRLNALLDIPLNAIINVEQKVMENADFQRPKKASSPKNEVAINNCIREPAFFDKKCNIIQDINKAIYNIEHSYQFYRGESKKQKLIVLKAGKDYLAKKINMDQFQSILKQNPNYVDAIRTSQTQLLVESILKIGLDNNATLVETIKKLA